jgi:hypothetical protein
VQLLGGGAGLAMMQRLVLATAAPPLVIRRAQTPAELRAAGCLRAAAFNIVPADRSEFSRQASAAAMTRQIRLLCAAISAS